MGWNSVCECVCVCQFGMTNEDLVGTKRRIRPTVLAMREAQS